MWARSAIRVSQTAAPKSPLVFPLVTLTALLWVGSSTVTVNAQSHSDTRVAAKNSGARAAFVPHACY